MATYISNQTGNWSSASTWLTAAAGTFTPTGSAGTPPQSFGYDKIFIRKNHVVTYDTSGVFGDGGTGLVGLNLTITSASIILSGGTLRASRTQNTALTALGVIWVASGTNNTNNGSFWDWGTLNDPISAVTSTISMSGIAAGQSGFYAQQNGSFTSSNSACFCGLEKTRNTFLTLSANTAQNKITVDSCRNWSVGDTIVIESDTTSTIRTLTGAKIQSIAGNEITLDKNVNFARLSGTRVGNFTSTVTYKTLESSPLAFGIGAMGTPNSNFEFSYISVENVNGTGWRSGPQTGVGFPVGGVYIHAEYQRRLPIFRGVAYQHTDSVNFQSHLFAAKFITDSELIIDDCAANVQRQFGPSSVFNFSTNTFVRVKNSVVYKSGRIIDPSANYKVTFDDCYLNTDPPISADTAVGNLIQFNRCKIRTNAALVPLANIASLKFNNCNITTLSSLAMFTNSFNSFGEFSLLNCTLNNTALSAYAFSPTTNKTLDDAAINIFNANNDNTYTTFNYYYHSVPNSSIRKNGITSLSFRPKVPNTPFVKTFIVPAVQGVTQKIKGNLRFDTNYGTTTPPSISFSGAVANTTFTSPASANRWNSFEYDLTPTYTGDIEILLTGASTLSTGFVYLDGLIFDPFIKDVRWYGFEFDKNFDRTVDTLTTLTENQVSSVDITNLDRLYDASNYWTINNPLSTSYLDLYTKNGDILNFGNRNIIFDNSASTNVAYASASNTITIKTPLLSSGNNFIGLRTTGNIYLSSGSTIGEIDIYGNAFQATPISLSGIYMEGTLAYNTDSSTTIEYTNCTMDTVQNDGDGIITIEKTNSTIANGLDAEIADYVPTILNVTLDGGYLAIYDDTGTRQYYQNTNGTIVLPSIATGNWTYKIAKYGYQYIQGSFVVDGNTGATIEIVPSYVPDIFVTSNVATVSAYTDLNTSEKIYNYLNYWTTTSSGIDYVPFYDKAFGSLTISKNVTLDATAGSILTYNGSTLLTLKCTGLSEDILFVSNGNVIAQNGTTYSDDVKIRAANLNSELILGGINSFTLYPSQSGRDNNTNIGPVLTGSLSRFLYGNVTSGVTLSGSMYARVVAGEITLLYESTFVQGTNALEFGTTGTLQQIISNQKIMNIGIQKASILVPHTTNI
jgi:hypothetical protein